MHLTLSKIIFRLILILLFKNIIIYFDIIKQSNKYIKIKFYLIINFINLILNLLIFKFNNIWNIKLR